MLELQIIDRRSGRNIRTYALGDSPEILVGRDESCDIHLSARSVSREHCVIEQSIDNIRIRDLGSTGGTLFRGEPIDEMRVQDGLEVEVGPALLRFIDS